MPRDTIQIPPMIDHPEVRKAAKEADRMAELKHKASGELEEARQALANAPAQDAADYAKAIAADKPDPGAKAEKKAKAAFDAKKREYEATKLAVATANDALMAAIAQHAPEITTSLEGQVGEAEARYRQTVADLGEVAERLSGSRGALAWLRQPQKRWNPKMSGVLRDLRGPNNEPLRWPVVIGALAEYGEKRAPQPTEPTLRKQPQDVRAANPPEMAVNLGGVGGTA